MREGGWDSTRAGADVLSLVILTVPISFGSSISFGGGHDREIYEYRATTVLESKYGSEAESS